MKNIKIYTRFATLSAAAMLMATPALTQNTTPEQADPPAAMGVPQVSGGSNASTDAAQVTDLMDKRVWSSDGKDLGAISKVNLGRDGGVESIHFSVGAILGFGGKTVMIDSANFSVNNDRVELKISAEAANALPEIKV